MSEEPKKKMKPLAWVGIGCGGLLLLAIIVVVLVIGKASSFVKENVGDLSDLKDNPEKFAAEMIVNTNPELTLMESNETDGTITFKDKNGKETTLSYQDLAEGKLTVETQDGETTTTTTMGAGGLEKMPKWFEVPATVTDWRSLMHVEEGEKSSGSLVGVSSLDVAATAETLGKALTDAGFEQKSKMESGGAISVSYAKEEINIVSLVITPAQDGKVAVQMSYQEK